MEKEAKETIKEEMKTVMYVSKLVVSKDYVALDTMSGPVKYKKGKVLEVKRSRGLLYDLHSVPFYVVEGHGIGYVVPVENLTTKHYKETTEKVVTLEPIKA